MDGTNCGESRVFIGNMKDIYFNATLSVGDKFITIQTADVKVIYPTCNVTKIVINKDK